MTAQPDAVVLPSPDMALDARGRPVPRLADGSPDWMFRAFTIAPRSWQHEVDGAAIEILEWGPPDAPALLLIHGQAAHADWWRFIAPQLAQTHRVLVPSLSGMGGSGWRQAYGVDQYAREIVALIAAAELDKGPGSLTLVGHSYGCLVALAVAQIVAPVIASLVLIDFYLPTPTMMSRLPPSRRVRRYRSIEDALARFRLSPPQACGNPEILDYIARRTVCFVGGEDPHWSWVSDPATLQQTDHAITRRNLASIACPLLILRGERSGLMDAAIAAHVRSIAPDHARLVEIPDADHHVLVDQPLATVAALRIWLVIVALRRRDLPPLETIL